MIKNIRTFTLSVPSFDAGKFCWNGKHGTVDMSELGKGPYVARCYQDSYDLGLTLVSPKTGKVKEFYVNKEVLQDGELVAIELLCVGDPQLKITLVND